MAGINLRLLSQQERMDALKAEVKILGLKKAVERRLDEINDTIAPTPIGYIAIRYCQEQMAEVLCLIDAAGGDEQDG